MARPIKKGLDYYTSSTTFMKDENILLLRYKYKADGFLLYHILLSDLYTAGYYLNITDSYLFSISGETRTREKKLIEMINYMVSIGLFDETLWKEKHILTSQTIQSFYFCAKHKYIKDEYINDFKYLLIENLNVKKQVVISEKTTQRKVKESKVKESKVKESKENNIKQEEKVVARTCENPKPLFGIQPSRRLKPVVSFAECGRYFQENWHKDESWKASMVMKSGRGMDTLKLVPKALLSFEAHIFSIKQSDEITNIEEYVRRFVFWWRSLDFKSAEEIDRPKDAYNNTGLSMQTGTAFGVKVPAKSHVNPISKMQEAQNVVEAARLHMNQHLI